MRIKTQLNRAGVTLLFVVSMIVLFLLMGTAFVVLAGDFMKSSKARMRKETHIYEGVELLDRAFYDLIREPDVHDLSSPMRFVGLLSDMYGYGFRATAIAPVSVYQNELIQIDVINPIYLLGASTVLARDFEWGGLVLTFVKGEYAGLSTRILRHEVINPTTHRLWLLPEPNNTDFRLDGNLSQLTNDPFNVIVNGRPFAGTGTNAFFGNQNLRGRDLASILATELSLPNGDVNHAATNEPFDAFDASTCLGPWDAATNTPTLTNGIGNIEDSYICSTAGTVDFGAGPITFAVGEWVVYSGTTWEKSIGFMPSNQNIMLAGINPNGTVRHSSFYRRNAGGINFAAISNGPVTEPANVRLVDNTNSGAPDGIWMDLGWPSRYSRDGTRYKPLVSYTIVDLDSRINVNFHGNLYDGDAHREMTDLVLAGPPATPLHRGSGYGTAEITLNELFPTAARQLMQGNTDLVGRYGADRNAPADLSRRVPGEYNVRDGWSGYKLYDLPNNPLVATPPGTVGRGYGTAHDIHGRFAVGYPGLMPDVWFPAFNIGLPIINVDTSNLTNEVVDSAYEFTAADSTFVGPQKSGENDDDRPFHILELERILRRFDIDVNLLPNRLLLLGGSDLNNAANSITTHSFEVPTLYDNLPRRLAEALQVENPSLTPQEIADQINLMLPPEVLRGLPMNINRPLPDGLSRPHPNGNDYANAAANWGEYYQSRYDYARQLYVLVLLLTERIDRNNDTLINQADLGIDLLEYRRTIAQWAVNVVDFRDNDAIMTPFEFDLNPWDGWDVDGLLTTNENLNVPPVQREVVWGAERPELLITETFASHDRRTEDTTLDSTGQQVPANGGSDPDYDSRLVPNVSFMVEVYNPWVMDDANQDQVSELWADDGTGNLGVDLQRTTPNGIPVWRMVVTDSDQAVRLDNPDGPGFNLNANIVRRIYFNQRTAPVGPNDLDFGQQDKVYFPAAGLTIPPVLRGRYGVIGSYVVRQGNEHITYFGRRRTANPIDPAELTLTRRISINPVAGTIRDYTWDAGLASLTETIRPDIVSVPIGQTFGGARNLGISDPIGGYGLGLPPNVTIEAIPDGLKYFNTTTLTDHAYDQPIDFQLDQQNYDNFLRNDGLQPNYRSVHLQRLANPLLPFNADSNPYLTIDSSPVDLMVFNGAEDSSNEPGIDPNGNIALLKTFERTSNGKNLFGNTLQSTPPALAGTPVLGDQHFLSLEFENTLGRLNLEHLNDLNLNLFSWLTWNNRPYVSQLELANVPYQSSYFLTRSANFLNNSANIFQPDLNLAPLAPLGVSPLRGHFNHLLNFYADRFQDGSSAPGLHRVFDFTEVPSRFVGTERFLNPDNYPPPFDSISSYRYPGKVNINTVLDDRVWNSLTRNYRNAHSYTDWQNLRDTNPYQPSLPGVTTSANTTLFRPNSTGTNPFFDFNSTDLYNNTERNAYFRYDARQRLGNLVTGRSSVFAIWITVGYFEVDFNEQPVLPNDGGRELGLDDGTSRRHRGFFIFDRSIPVAFEPGKNHNIDQAILIRRIIE